MKNSRQQQEKQQQQKQNQRQTLNAPSGIAQLRKSSEQSIPQHSDAMNLDNLDNLDDFLISDDFALPQQEPRRRVDEKSNQSITTAIPINKSRREPKQHTFVPQSVPVPAHRHRVQDEFGYVPRHVRKTSIDDRQVGVLLEQWLVLLTCPTLNFRFPPLESSPSVRIG